MRTLLLTLVGVLVLLAFIGIANAVNKRRGTPGIDAYRAFVFIGLGISAAHFYIGVVREGYPVAMELAVHAVIFGVPALLAWYLSRRSRRTPASPTHRDSE
jgi:hypothetical protein